MNKIDADKPIPLTAEHVVREQEHDKYIAYFKVERENSALKVRKYDYPFVEIVFDFSQVLGGVVCMIRKNGVGEPYVGMSIFNPKDIYDKKTGKKIALRRAITQMIMMQKGCCQSLINRDTRTLWHLIRIADNDETEMANYRVDCAEEIDKSKIKNTP